LLRLLAPADGLTLVRKKWRGAHLRPIITGCLAECGAKDQSCVTQCQVCIEQNACESLMSNCTMCLRETHDAMRDLFSADNNVQDSGGDPLVHEAIRQDLHGAKLKAIEGKRRLRKARNQVLTAQRQVEWAVEERRDAADALRKGEKTLEKQENNAKGWKTSSSGRIRDMQRYLDKMKRQEERTKRQIAILERKMKEKHDKAREAKERAKAGARKQETLAMQRLMERLQAKLRVQEKAVRKEEARLEKEQNEAKWFRRGLRQEVHTVAASVKAQIQTLHEARKAEQISEKELIEAKDTYRKVAEASHEISEFVHGLETSLSKNPMPDFLPESVKRAMGEPPL